MMPRVVCHTGSDIYREVLKQFFGGHHEIDKEECLECLS